MTCAAESGLCTVDVKIVVAMVAMVAVVVTVGMATVVLMTTVVDDMIVDVIVGTDGVLPVTCLISPNFKGGCAPKASRACTVSRALIC